MAYANVVLACWEMAKSQDTKSNEAVLTSFYTNVVKKLRDLEKGFRFPNKM